MFRTVDNKNGQAQCGCICSLNCMMRSIFSECLSYKTPDHKLDDTSHPPGPLDDPPPDASNNILDYFHMAQRMVFTANALKTSAWCPAHPCHSTIASASPPTIEQSHRPLPRERGTSIYLLQVHVLFFVPHRVSGHEGAVVRPDVNVRRHKHGAWMGVVDMAPRP